MKNNLKLRDVIEDDLPIFFEQQLASDANFMAAFTAKDPANQEAFDAHWDRILADETVIIQTIISSGHIVGYVLSYKTDGKLEVSYWIGRVHWGQGLATVALSDFLIHTNRIRPIYARVAKDNLGSIRVLQKCGFKIIGEAIGFANARGEEIEELVLELIAKGEGEEGDGSTTSRGKLLTV